MRTTRGRKLPPVIQDINRSLQRIYGKRLKKIILFGSHARGQATSESDVDLLIVLDQLSSLRQEVEKLVPVVARLNLKYGVLASCLPVSVSAYEDARCPLFVNIQREGVVVHG
ncbi:MAG: nucleotidyltransferase family protein [bacterium]